MACHIADRKRKWCWEEHHKAGLDAFRHGSCADGENEKAEPANRIEIYKHKKVATTTSLDEDKIAAVAKPVCGKPQTTFSVDDDKIVLMPRCCNSQTIVSFDDDKIVLIPGRCKSQTIMSVEDDEIV